jgi:hypothetical protein
LSEDEEDAAGAEAAAGAGELDEDDSTLSLFDGLELSLDELVDLLEPLLSPLEEDGFALP